MPETKRYFWLKLKETFFEDENIRIIEDKPDGQKYIVFYLKLMLKTIKTDGMLQHKSCIPYTPDMLAAIFRTDERTVKEALALFEQLQIVEMLDDGALFMADVLELTGSETTSAERMRKSRRSREMLRCNSGVSQCDKNVTTEIRVKSNTPIAPNGGECVSQCDANNQGAQQGESLTVSQMADGTGIKPANHSTTLVQRFDRFWTAYPKRLAKKAAFRAFKKIAPDDGLLETMLTSIGWQRCSTSWTKDGGQYIPYPATWLNAGQWEDEPTAGAGDWEDYLP